MKHFKTFISVVVILISFFSMPTKAQSRYDVNSDGKVNITDAISVVNKILNGSSDNENTPAEAVDLGLPSGTKWASCNLGASSPEDPGGRYAWGETEEKLVYSDETYVNFDKSTHTFRNIGNDICGTVYDVAHVKWGGLWHMPSQADFEELVTFSTYEWTTFRGVRGGKFTGPNGKSIFLPIIDLNNNDYWLGYDDGFTPITGYWYDLSNGGANCFTIAEEPTGYFDYRSLGLLIRPVYSNISTSKIVDLGLPSGTRWASCNVGASYPEDVGGKYAWGETGEKSVYDWSTYMHCNGTAATCLNIGSDISGTKFDVAHVKWGDNWRMPTKDEISELINNCKHLYIDGGLLFTGPNGNSIFLPEATTIWSSTLDTGPFAFSFTSFIDMAGDLYYFLHGDSPNYRCEGYAVRPVYSPSSPPATVEIIDLGLPSGTKWASCNVGATKPEEYGGYYAWGEIEEKEVYNQSTYKYYQNGKYVNLGSDISGTEYDVAHAKWGGKWCMPTLDDIKELLDNCTFEWTTLNGVEGEKFTSKILGNSIFLPAAGFRWDGDLIGAGSWGYYWSSMRYPDDSFSTYGLYFYSGDALWVSNGRSYGRSVRPVVRN